MKGRFKPWSVAANQALLAESMKPILAELPPGAVVRIAGYPARLRCATTATTSP